MPKIPVPLTLARLILSSPTHTRRRRDADLTGHRERWLPTAPTRSAAPWLASRPVLRLLPGPGCRGRRRRRPHHPVPLHHDLGAPLSLQGPPPQGLPQLRALRPITRPCSSSYFPSPTTPPPSRTSCSCSPPASPSLYSTRRSSSGTTLSTPPATTTMEEKASGAGGGEEGGWRRDWANVEDASVSSTSCRPASSRSSLSRSFAASARSTHG